MSHRQSLIRHLSGAAPPPEVSVSTVLVKPVRQWDEVAGRRYAGDRTLSDSGNHAPTQVFSNQTERAQTASASQAEMPAPQRGWNKGSQYGVEWLTRTANARSEENSTNRPHVSSAHRRVKTATRNP